MCISSKSRNGFSPALYLKALLSWLDTTPPLWMWNTYCTLSPYVVVFGCAYYIFGKFICDPHSILSFGKAERIRTKCASNKFRSIHNFFVTAHRHTHTHSVEFVIISFFFSCLNASNLMFGHGQMCSNTNKNIKTTFFFDSLS